MRNVFIVEDELADEAAFHAFAKGALGFPEWYGGNLSALADCLGDVDEPTRLVFSGSDEDEGSSPWFSKAVRVAERAAGENPALEVVSGAAGAALARLERGSAAFLQAERAGGDVSPGLRKRLFEEGQRPYACVIACSDSRVVPEALFSCGLGELFCVRTAGNTVGAGELASVVYAVEHLGVRLVVVLGHTGCGAVAAALEGQQDGAVAAVTDAISAAIGDERDPDAASVANARAGAARLWADGELAPLLAAGADALHVIPALYHTDSGKVEWL